VAAVLLKISQMAATLFSMIISESRGAVCAIESMRHPWQQLMISESTGALFVVESMRHPWKQFC
jgi:hypothetical protein